MDTVTEVMNDSESKEQLPLDLDSSFDNHKNEINAYNDSFIPIHDIDEVERILRNKKSPKAIQKYEIYLGPPSDKSLELDESKTNL